MAARIVVGVDGGGTHTRAMVADTHGRVLASGEAGGSNPNHHPRAKEHAQEAIRHALDAAGCHPGQVVALVAGFAGLDDAEDHEWADRFTAVPGLDAPRLHVNDAVVAHAGALESGPGIIAISGTGSIVMGVTPGGRQIRNYDFHHYACSAARHLGYEAVYRIVAGETEAADRPFVEAVLAFWGVSDAETLCARAAGGFESDPTQRKYRLGQMARLVTEAAGGGVPVARAVCEQAAGALATGIRLVGACFPEGRVRVALIGGVARSTPMQQALSIALARNPHRHYEIVEPRLSSVQGALLMALEQCGTRIDDALLNMLAASTPTAVPS